MLVVASIVAIVKLPSKQGLDLAGGVRVVLQAQTDKMPAGKKWDEKSLASIISIIRRRVDNLGVSEPLIQPKGTDQVIVELPNIKNKDQAIAALQSTARMEFRHLQNVKTKRHPAARYQMSVEKDDNGNDVYTFTDSAGNKVPTAQVIAESKLILSGDEIQTNSRGNIDQSSGGHVVELEFTDTGKEKFAEFTRRNQGEYLAIVLEDRILSAPTIDEPILDGKAIIRGNFTADEAQKLADNINSGALPVPLDVIQSQSVEPTLGQGSITKSVQAGIVGLVLVMLFMVVYYLLPGLIADIALVIYALLTLALFKVISVTMTLPGIAAYILSIGMAVDANILIFERLKEELRSGKTLKAAIDAGFSRAFTSIFDSNMCTAITASILWYYGTGPIRGFAVILLLGVVVSMFTAITATRTILYLLVDTGVATHPALFGLRRQWVTGKSGRQMNIVGKMWLWFTLSALILVPGMYFFATGGLHKGIDFTGGSMMQVEFRQTADSAAIGTSLKNIGLTDSIIQKSSTDPNLAFIRTKVISSEKAAEVKAALTSMGGTIQSEDRVGATISKELEQNALMAVLFASLAIILYLSVRFAIGGIAQGFRFGMCAILATLHDVGVIIGVFAILGHFLNWEIDSLFVTAVLTIIGFSTHDTIVIFDRIRENLRHKGKNEDFDGLVNRSILQSFARSINTSLTVIITLTALLCLGAHNIRQFVAALLIGVVSGTYSSIFNASQLLVLWNRIVGGRQAAAAVTAAGPVLRPVNPEVSAPAAKVDENVESAADSASKAKAKKNKRRY